MTTISIATWNVNSIRSRLMHLLEWLRSGNAPDVLCLQELKVVNENFPLMEIEELGYNCAVHGQKTYNGVGILSRFPLEDIVTTLPGDGSDEQARYIEAVISLEGAALRVASVYVPNGQAVDSEKFAYKMAFYDRLLAHTQNILAYEEPFVLAGDFNVAPAAVDVYDPAGLEGTVCFHPAERAKLRRLLHSGLYDAWRAAWPEKQQFSWWDYRGNGWKMNKGLRIDHLFLSPMALDCMERCEILDNMRDADKASDHTPVMCHLNVETRKSLFAA